MESISWQPEYSVNIKKIDTQHKRIVEMINELTQTIEMGQENSDSGKMLSELINYSEVHFKTEEDYFDKYEYPEKDKHKKEHQLFISKTADFIDDFDSDNEILCKKILIFLIDWLKEHIIGSDQKYMPYLNSKGVS